MKPFHPDEFTPTKWETAADKAAFANWLARFLAAGSPRALLSKQRYQRLSTLGGFCAEYNRDGFYTTHFATPESRVAFLNHLQQCMPNGCWGVGDPAWTYSDVERAITRWLTAPTTPDYRRAAHDACQVAPPRVVALARAGALVRRVVAPPPVAQTQLFACTEEP